MTTDALVFDGRATARPSASNASRAGELGFADYGTRNPADGIWNAKLTIVGEIDDVPGRWRASRQPITP